MLLSRLVSVRSIRSSRGFTLVETLVAITVFAIVIGVSSSIFFDAFATERKTQISRALFEETRIALERVVKEIRRGTVDYEAYWNWYHCQTGCEVAYNSSEPAAFYGKNYGTYALQFFRNASDAVPATRASHSRHDENLGTTEDANTSDFAIQSAGSHPGCQTADTPGYIAPNTQAYQQCELYLISADGTEKTIVKTILDVVDLGGGATRTEYRLAILRLDGIDAGYDGVLATVDADGSQQDGQIDTWQPAAGFTDGSGQPVFRAIQPDTLTITNVRFFVSPLADPRKAFAQFDDDVQMQPHITILLTAEPSGVQTVDGRRVMAGVRGAAPSITLQTTVTARAQTEISSLK